MRENQEGSKYSPLDIADQRVGRGIEEEGLNLDNQRKGLEAQVATAESTEALAETNKAIALRVDEIAQAQAEQADDLAAIRERIGEIEEERAA